jgi:thiamine pyrophosphate-dependent acetolactate synthase large subunit-like protein
VAVSGIPDFVVYANSYGIKGAHVESADGLVPVLEATLPQAAFNSSPHRSTIRRTCGS